jgi:hypothetical protein
MAVFSVYMPDQDSVRSLTEPPRAAAGAGPAGNLA